MPMTRFLRSTIKNKLTCVSGAAMLTALVLCAAAFVTGSVRLDAQTLPVEEPVTSISIGTVSYGTTTATINYTTDVAAVTTVNYGTSTTGMTTVLDVDNGSYLTGHTANFTGLTPGTTYYYVIRATSADAAETTIDSTTSGSCVTVGNVCSFSTTSINVSNIAVSINGSTNTATLTFSLSQAASTAVNYGTVPGSLNLQVGASVTSGTGYTATLPNLPASSRIYFEVVAGSNGTGQHSFFIGPLSITDLPAQPSSITDRSALITWTTNLPSSHEVSFGLDQNALTSHAQSYVVNGVGHSVTIASGLLPGTTYYYTVTSTISPDVPVSPSSYTGAQYTVTSTTAQSFTTAGVSPGTQLVFSSDPVANASSDEATITFGTNLPTSALVEFNTNAGLSPDPKTTGYLKVCNDPAVCTSEAPAWIKPGDVEHSIRITGLSTPDRDYYYRVTVKDQNGRSISSGLLKFRTTLSRYDHKFSTGQCSDGTPIRSCKDGMYCRPGGIGPVYDCRPGLECTYECPTGSTCQDTGDCTKDPAPGDALTACNPKSCYLKCDNRSGDMSGKRCGVDADCNSGKCVVGSFTAPAAVGCYSSWPSCDANVILKVRPDRVCEKWYTCKSSVEITTSTGKTQNQCLDLTICDSISPNGQCNNLLEGRQCSNDPLRFCKEDSDCIGAGAFCLDPAGICGNDSGGNAGTRCTNDDECGTGTCLTKLTLTFDTPEDVAQIKGLTGYAFAGLNWHAQPGTCSSDSGDQAGDDCFNNADCGTAGTCENEQPVINGLYPLSVAEQIGQPIDIPDGDFEDYAQVLQCSKKREWSCSLNKVPDDCVKTVKDDTVTPAVTTTTDYGPCVANRDTQRLIARYWESVTPPGSVSDAAISVDADVVSSNSNQMLKVTPTDLAGSGVTSTSTMNITTSEGSDYLISVVMKSSRQGQVIQVGFRSSAGDESVLDTVTLGTAWKQYLIGPAPGVNGPTSILFTTVEENDDIAPFWLDNLSIIPALKVSDTRIVPQSCRVYPNSSSPSCDYTDSNGISYRGYKGYCLERDPMNVAVCLSWWPVDIVAGNNVFGTDVSSGYNDRQPLYACAEAEGKWNSPSPNTGATTFEERDCDQSPAGASSLYPGQSGGLCGQPLGYYRPMTTVLDAYVHSAGGDDTIEDRGLCRDNLQPGFCFCYIGDEFARNAGSDGWVAASAADQTIHKYDIEYFRVHFMRYTPDSANGGWPNVGDLILNEGNNWYAKADNGVNRGEEIRLRWNSIDQHLEGYYLFAWNYVADNEHDFDKSTGFYATGMFLMKEQCTTLVQVATENDVLAWVDRTSKTGTYVVPALKYRYITDLSPFGTAAAPSTTLNPDEWLNQDDPGVLTVEGIDLNQSWPYQMRAGAAYACNGNCTGRMCTNATGSKVGAGCLTSADCLDSSVNPPVSGQCIGNGVCVKYDSDSNKYTFNQSRVASNSTGVEVCTHDYVGGKVCNAASGKRTGRVCTADTDCAYTVGKCVNKDSSGTGKCDANSGVLKDDYCYTDATCQTTYDGKCVSQMRCSGNTTVVCTENTDCGTNGTCSVGACPTGERCCSNKDEVCVGGQASGPTYCSNDHTRACTNDSDCGRVATNPLTYYPCNYTGRGSQTFTNSTTVTPTTSEMVCNGASGVMTGQPCSTNAECGYTPTNTSPQCTLNLSAYFSQYYIMRLFAKAYSVWQWSDVSRSYVNATSRCTTGSSIGMPCNDDTDCGGVCTKTDLWSQPTIICRVCSGGPTPNKACTTDTDCTATCVSSQCRINGVATGQSCATNNDCGSAGACIESPSHPTSNALGVASADYCAVKPTVFNIVNVGKSALIDEGSQYTLQFNTTVDEEQLPLAGITIKWGDGTETVDAPIKIAPRDDPSKPHVYSHVYHCQGTSGVCEPYYIKIRVVDNWGWCSNGTDGSNGALCSNDTATWTDGPAIQVLR